MRPFEALTPAIGIEHVQWATDQMAGKEGVALVVPGGFDAYLRIHHPLSEGARRWADDAPQYLVSGTADHEYPFPVGLDAPEGDLGEAWVDDLVPLLTAATATPDRCHFGLWNGWGWTNGSWGVLTVLSSPALLPKPIVRWRNRRASRRANATAHAADTVPSFIERCAVHDWWGGRSMALFDGPIDTVAAIGHQAPGWDHLSRQSPQWWWPEDRAWFLGTEIDDPWTYLAGSEELIGQVAQLPDLECVRVHPTDAW